MCSKIPIGISSCLLGEEVRFDGGHKRDAYILGTLLPYFEFRPFCPEVAIGLGTPRQPIRLVQLAAGEVRVRGVREPDLDVTDALYEYGVCTAAGLGDLCGYILKRGSPSCGMERVKVYAESGMPVGSSTGMYAQALRRALPLVPMEEEGRLGDPVLRENFIERVFVLARWRALVAGAGKPGALVDFHATHKLQIMAHSQAAYRRLGQLVAGVTRATFEDVASEYVSELMATLARRATRKSNANVLQHLMGYLKRAIDAEDKQELLEIVEDYRTGKLPLVVPITLLRHHFRRHPHDYVARQTYLEPHPSELMLRNQV